MTINQRITHLLGGVNNRSLIVVNVCFFLLMAAVLLIPCGALGQDGNFTHQSFGGEYTGNFSHQSFGGEYTGNFTHQSFGIDLTGGFTHQSFGGDYTGGFTHQSFGGDYTGGFTNQSFGGDYEGNFTHQSFEDPAPIGNGLLVLIAAGLGYAASKRKKQQIK